MEAYRRVVRDIEKERTNFLSKIDLVQPSFEEQHQLEMYRASTSVEDKQRQRSLLEDKHESSEWGSRYQEEELALLREETEKASRELEVEIKRLQERDELIRRILDEQRQDRMKIQTLLALSQPITPDIAVVFESMDTVALLGDSKPTGRGCSSREKPLPSRRRRLPTREFLECDGFTTPCVTATNISTERSEGVEGSGVGAPLPAQRTAANFTREVHGERETTQGRKGGEAAARTRGEDCVSRMTRDGVDVAVEDGGVLGEHAEVCDDDKAGRSCESPRRNPRLRPRSRIGIDWGVSRLPGAGPSDRLEWRHTEGSGPRQRRRRRRVQGEEREEIGESDSVDGSLGAPWMKAGEEGEDEPGESKDGCVTLAGSERDGDEGGDMTGGFTRMRCTQGYQQLLLKRLERTQRHLQGIELLSRDYYETLRRDAQERAMQAQVQRESTTTVAKTLRTRIAEVDERLVQTMDEYLRLRHRAKEAHAASSQEQREQSQARLKLETELQVLNTAAEHEREAIARNGQRRLEDETQDLREMLKRAEGVLQEERLRHKIIREGHDNRLTRARESILLLKRQHRALVGRRAKEVVHLNNEISTLRQGLTELERRMLWAW